MMIKLHLSKQSQRSESGTLRRGVGMASHLEEAIAGREAQQLQRQVPPQPVMDGHEIHSLDNIQNFMDMSNVLSHN